MQQLQSTRIGTGPGRPFLHRGTRADLGVIQQMFESQDYSFERLRRGPELTALYKTIAGTRRQPLILDAGANIGASVVYFHLAFRAAHIVALEPERNNFEVLKQNVAGIDVDARCEAIGAVSGEAQLIDPGEGEWGYRTVSASGGERVRVLSASELVKQKTARGYEPFIAKIDIEGGEGDLFSSDTGWVDQFPVLIVELHDWLLPGSANSRNFLKCVAALNRDFVYIGENVFSIRNG
jgi:FkbM family methyltransferase